MGWLNLFFDSLLWLFKPHQQSDREIWMSISHFTRFTCCHFLVDFIVKNPLRMCFSLRTLEKVRWLSKKKGLDLLVCSWACYLSDVTLGECDVWTKDCRICLCSSLLFSNVLRRVRLLRPLDRVNWGGQMIYEKSLGGDICPSLPMKLHLSSLWLM